MSFAETPSVSSRIHDFNEKNSTKFANSPY